MSLTAPVQPSLCPLCGQANQCAMAAGEDPQSCWCMSQPISEQALQALAQTVPAAQRGKACICLACGTGLPSPGHPATH